MKIRSLYSNDSERFSRILFHDGLNVVFARVEDPSIDTVDSHNLGKTFLIRVLDFALLAGIDKKHPFRVNDHLFRDFVFFIELETNARKFVTIRRAVTGRKTICINVSSMPNQDFATTPTETWDLRDLGKDKAREKLSGLLNLSSILPYDYRKGLGYFLRRQTDYTNEFVITRFGRGKDRDWKPFMALLLGFDHALVAEKYKLDRREDEINAEIREAERLGGSHSEKYDELRGVSELKQEQIARLHHQVDNFDFVEVETDVTRKTVRNVESQIADLNEHRYGLEQEEAEIDRALATEFGFNIETIQGVFEEAGAALPNALIHDYEELIAFNQRISSGRMTRLRERRTRLRVDLATTQDELESLNQQRVSALRLVTQRETLKKFRELQKNLLKEEEAVVTLRALWQHDRLAVA